jgi:hypothetical protein
MAPAVIVPVHRALCAFFVVSATHILPTLRPLTRPTKLNATFAASLRLNENVVPTGGLLAMRAREPPLRQRLADRDFLLILIGALMAVGVHMIFQAMVEARPKLNPGKISDSTKPRADQGRRRPAQDLHRR